MPDAPRRGFTLLEVMVAALLLTVGIGALAGTLVHTTRMVVRGRQATRQLEAGLARLESLRARATSPAGDCGPLDDGIDSLADGTVRRWRVQSPGPLREVSVMVSVPVPGGWTTDTLRAVLWCPS